MRRITFAVIALLLSLGTTGAQQRPNGEPMIGTSPSVLTVFPGDDISISMRTTYPPPLYVTDGSAALLNSDYSLTVNNSTFEGYRGGLQLRSGSGSVKWTLTSQCLPGASESIGFLIGVDGSGNNILDIRFSNTQYKIYDSSGLLQTTTYTAASGDEIKLALDGPVLRAYINDELVYTKAYTSTNPYPARYVPTTFAALATSVSGYKIPPPELTGNWQCTEDYVDWNVPSTLATDFTTTDDERTVQMTVSGNPGTYTVTGLVGVGHAIVNGSVVTATDKINIGVPFTVNETVQFGTTPGDTLPGGLSPDTTYYVKTYSAGDITVSLTQGGSTVDITSQGTGGWCARTGEIALQSGTATVVIPAFDVLGIPQNNVIEIEAGETALFKTTYDGAQDANNGSYITRTVVTGGGGSFASATNVYTAPATAGDYTIRFECSNQRRDFTVRVPTTLLPVSEPVYPGEARTNTTTMGGSLTWAATGSVSLSGSGQTRTWTAPATVGQIVRISVTNGTLTRYQDYKVTDVLPVAYSFIQDAKTGPRTLIEETDGGRKYFSRTLTESGFVPWEGVVVCNGLSVDDYEDLVAFNDEHLRSGEPFILTDYLIDSLRRTVRFDSIIENPRTVNDCVVNCSFRVKAV